MAKRGDRMAAKQRRQEREKQRRLTVPETDPGPEAFGIKMPSAVGIVAFFSFILMSSCLMATAAAVQCWVF